MKGSARRLWPVAAMNACCSSPQTRPTSNIRSPRFIRSRSIAATSRPCPKRKVAGGAPPCHPPLPVLPHRGPVSPQVLQPQQLVGVPCPDALPALQPGDELLEIAAVGVEVERSAVGGPIMLRGKEIAQSLEPPEEMGVVALMNGPRDRLTELLAGVELQRQNAVDVRIDGQWTDHVVRGANQVVAAQPLQALILPVGHCGGAVAVPAESRAVELADDPDVGVFVLGVG